MSDSKLDRVVQADVDEADTSIRSVNTGLSSMERTAPKTARGASAGINGLTASMVISLT